MSPYPLLRERKFSELPARLQCVIPTIPSWVSRALGIGAVVTALTGLGWQIAGYIAAHAGAILLGSLAAGFAAGVLAAVEMRRAGIPQALALARWRLLVGEIRSPPSVWREGRLQALVYLKSFAPYQVCIPQLECLFTISDQYDTERAPLRFVKQDHSWGIFRVDAQIPVARYEQFLGVLSGAPHHEFVRLGAKFYVERTNDLVLDGTWIAELGGQVAPRIPSGGG